MSGKLTHGRKGMLKTRGTPANYRGLFTQNVASDDDGG